MEQKNLINEFTCLNKDFENKKPTYYFSKGLKALKSFYISIIDCEETLCLFHKLGLVDNISMNAVRKFKIPEAHLPYIVSRKNELEYFLNSNTFKNYANFVKDHNVEMFFNLPECHSHQNKNGDIIIDNIDKSKMGYYVTIDGVDYKY
jgi:hypothetical protein